MPDIRQSRPSPDELLRQVEAQVERERRGRLKVFLGYASGVGKSFRMLDEGRRRRDRGEDVVVGAIQPRHSQHLLHLLGQFETIPMLVGDALDVEAIRRRRPEVCLIDGLAYRNPVGAPRQHRWQDVGELLSAGINVITTVNLQYISEKQAQVEAIRGKSAADSLPGSFLVQADDIEIVDAPPEYCIDRSRTYPNVDPDTLSLQLSELREIALVFAAEIVDAQLLRYLKRHGIEQTYGTQERILVCITPRSNAPLMIERAQRQADRFHGEFLVAYVKQPQLSAEDRISVQRNLNAARDAGARVVTLSGADPVAAILAFARQQAVTQIFIGHSQRSGFWQRLRANPVE